MRKCTIALLCLAAFCGTPNVQAQSFLNKIKNAAKEKVEKEVKKAVRGNATSAVSGGSRKSDRSGSSASSTDGQTGTVLGESSSGAKVEIGGVVYVLHDKGKTAYAFISEVVGDELAGKALELPDYVTHNGKRLPVRGMRGGAFKGTTITSVRLPSTLHEIPNSAFRETSITEITIPASVAIVQGSAFYGCRQLRTAVFEGSSAKEIHGCFQNCVSLASVRFPRSVGKMSYDMFSGCTGLTSVSLPENLSEVYPSMFKNCTSLKKVAIPRSVTKVEAYAFSGCGVVELDLSNVTEFGDGCFSGCKSLKSLKLNSSLKSVFVSDIYLDAGIDQVPSLQVKYVNDQYVLPSGITFVDGK